MFDSMIQQARQVTTSGLCRGELEGLVAGAGRVIAALGALQTRCATEIESLDDGGVNSKTVLREQGRMSTRNANSVAKTAAGLAEMPKLAEVVGWRQDHRRARGCSGRCGRQDFYRPSRR